ncbi:NAD(P)/FAD-dependent oxidoreductase [Pseudonocardia eucalypti]|uniref:Pyridine nucleotide-disulfide oxidoreductase domain-containing protein 2 n=1 Tax=Pseudonocardia eucalypti TaxID=648755 RepID=A0ABP9QBX0_9PSEU|nr:phytoene dehydrogenase-like protein [Pseudonocardia eucalypti]
MSATDVIVVGAGHNGLTAACYLARAGRSVLVVESAGRVGGMTSTNPVLAGAPEHRINEGAMDSSLWRTTRIPRELELHRFGLTEIEVDPPYAFLDQDGSSLCIHRDPRRTAEEIARFSRPDAAAYLDLANTLDAAMNVAVPFLNTNPVRPSPAGILRGAARSALRPGRLGPLAHFFSTSHAEFVEERFTDRRVRALLAALPCFAPMFADGTAWVLIYFGLIHRAGVGRFAGGTGAVTDALARCLASHGGRIRVNATVDGLVTRHGRVTGVRLDDGTELPARAVLTTNNVRIPLTEWLPEGALPKHLARRAAHIPTDSTGASSFKVDVALRGRVEVSAHRAGGVDLRTPALVWTTFEEHVQAWHDCARGRVPDPLPGVAILPAGADPSQAPAGQDTFWFWSGISPVRPTEPWSELAGPTAERVLATASKYLGGLAELEIDRQVMTPPDFERRFRAPDGNVYHVDPTATRFGPLRPAAGLAGYRSPVDGLFLSGGGTHPSAGICGVPGQQAAKAVLRTLR